MLGKLGSSELTGTADEANVAQWGLDKMLFFLAAGFTQRRLHTSDAAK
jgi:hypothetical protein